MQARQSMEERSCLQKRQLLNSSRRGGRHRLGRFQNDNNVVDEVVCRVAEV